MPIYEYRCAACGHTLDALQKLSELPLKKCPECKKSSLKRLVSAPSFRLKGAGWYETDFKSGNEKKRNLVEGSGTSSKESSGSDSPKAESPTKDSPTTKEAPTTKDSTSKESSGAASKDAKPAAKESARKSSSKKRSPERPAST